ncbi:HisA/HisF family protein [Methanobacterium sp. ACI-7]|uniref:HisA/HisF family protein n=1 Tax=unclassified Methanobacterium TaxID=2627676 RepID=UPI0039C486E4
MIIPVLDIKNGTAISGKSGNRETYKPLKTVFSNSSSPIEIARALADAGASRMYIADLDAIESKGSNLELIKKINSHISVMVDCGASNIEDIKKALFAADKVIVATETLKNIDDLNKIFNSFSSSKIVISIDIKDGNIYSNYLDLDFEDVVIKLRELNPSEIIMLDISKVGTENGVNQEFIDKLSDFKDSLIIGGGITKNYITSLEERGINKFLVGTALHNGKLNL